MWCQGLVAGSKFNLHVRLCLAGLIYTNKLRTSFAATESEFDTNERRRTKQVTKKRKLLIPLRVAFLLLRPFVSLIQRSRRKRMSDTRSRLAMIVRRRNLRFPWIFQPPPGDVRQSALIAVTRSSTAFLPSAKYMTQLSAAKRGLGMPAKPGLRLRLITTTVRH